jgi:hypothetical protein
MLEHSSLSPPSRERLARICGLLGSDYEGERANAALAATRLLQRHGLTWGDLFSPKQPDEPPLTPPSYGQHHLTQAAFALRHLDFLTDWEKTFVRSVASKPRLTEKQRAHLAEIVTKVSQAAAA